MCCWASFNKKSIKPLVAKNGFKVIKFFCKDNDGNLIDSHSDYKHEIDKNNDFIKLRIERFNRERLYLIGKGYHSIEYSPKIIVKECTGNKWYGLEYPNHRFEDLSSDKHIRWHCSFHSELPYECIIPKGAKYYLNENHEIVSETIIVKEPAEYDYGKTEINTNNNPV